MTTETIFAISVMAGRGRTRVNDRFALLARKDTFGHTPSIAILYLPPRKDVVNQCLEFNIWYEGTEELRWVDGGLPLLDQNDSCYQRDRLG